MNLDQMDEVLTGSQLGWKEVVAAVVLVALGALASYAIGRWRRRRLGTPGGQSQQLVGLLARIAQMLVLAVFVGWALTTLGSDIGLLTVMVVVALLIGVLAARPVLEGMGASAALTTRPAFSVGDEIAVDDAVGRVVRITNRSTVIRQRDGLSVHVPNVEMLSKTVVVYTSEEERRSAVDVTVSFDSDIDQVEALLREALSRIEQITRLGAIRARALGQGIELSVRFWHPPDIQSGNEAVDAAVRTIVKTLRTEAIRFAPPVEVAIIRDSAAPRA